MTDINKPTYEEACQMINHLIFAVQKVRSNVLETLTNVSHAQLSDELLEAMGERLTGKWIFGPNCVLPALIETQNRIEQGKRMTAMEFYNYMWIASRVSQLGILKIQGYSWSEPTLELMNHCLAWDNADGK